MQSQGQVIGFLLLYILPAMINFWAMDRNQQRDIAYAKKCGAMSRHPIEVKCDMAWLVAAICPGINILLLLYVIFD